MHRDLLHLRRAHQAISQPSRIDGAVLRTNAMVLRYFSDTEHLLLVINLGCDLDLSPAPEPLLAPPGPGGWSLLWSSESVAYGGQGTAPLKSDGEWTIQGETALLLHSALAEGHGTA